MSRHSQAVKNLMETKKTKQPVLFVKVTDEEHANVASIVEALPDPYLTISKFVRDAVTEKATRERKKLARRNANTRQ